MYIVITPEALLKKGGIFALGYVVFCNVFSKTVSQIRKKKVPIHETGAFRKNESPSGLTL